MATLSYNDFMEKYVFNSGIKSIEESFKNELGDNNLDIFDMIMESVGESFYQDYLDGKLDYIEEQDKPNNNK